MLKNIRFKVISLALNISITLYRALYLPIRINMIRKKKTITVAFVISDLGKWKTESLFGAMLNHSRFEPYLLVTPYIDRDNSGLIILCNYLKKKGYDYHLLDQNRKISDIIRPDIIFYQEPYNNIVDSSKGYKRNLRSLFCYVSYGFHCEENHWLLNQPLLNFCWQVYYENGIAMHGLPDIMTNHANNCIITGLPMTEVFSLPDTVFRNPWNERDNKRLKIIWAPHYSINKSSPFHYSTFLRYYNFMFELAAKYNNLIQIAFKPHPLLLTKLYEIWGKNKTDDYFSQWENKDNTQLIKGDYVSLFKYSDAMIHDCSSFTIEYHYTLKPVMYLIKDDCHADGLNDFGRMAFDLHYKGRCEKDIESFIQDVITGKDEMKNAREKFYNDYLLPPNGKSPSANIINAILG